MPPELLKRLIAHFARFPGIGRKTAERIAFFILKLDEATFKDFLKSLVAFRRETRPCPICLNLTTGGRCEICQDPKRDSSLLCVVEDISDLYAIENTQSYKGLYHILGLVPPDGKEDNPAIEKLLTRIKRDKIKEVILATNPTTEGELIANYLAKVLKPLGVLTTRIARGIPLGTNLELADSPTITQAIEGRKEI